jgi:hypothetical protein
MMIVLFSGDAKRRKTNKLKPIEKQNGASNGDMTQFQQPKKDRENFRKALVDICPAKMNFLLQNF